MSECWIKPFDMPDEKRVFTKGIFELINVAGMTLGRATYEPSWVWSKHVGPEIGKSSCDVAHDVVEHMSSQPTFGAIAQPRNSPAGIDIRTKTTSA